MTSTRLMAGAISRTPTGPPEPGCPSPASKEPSLPGRALGPSRRERQLQRRPMHASQMLDSNPTFLRTTLFFFNNSVFSHLTWNSPAGVASGRPPAGEHVLVAGGRRKVCPPALQVGPTAHRSHRLPRDPQSPCACDRLHRDEDPSWRTSRSIQGNGSSAPGPLGPSGTGSSHVTPWPSERQASAK